MGDDEMKRDKCDELHVSPDASCGVGSLVLCICSNGLQCPFFLCH